MKCYNVSTVKERKLWIMKVYVCQMVYSAIVMEAESMSYFQDLYNVRHAFLTEEEASQFLATDHSDEVWEALMKRYDSKRKIYVDHEPRGKCTVYEAGE